MIVYDRLGNEVAVGDLATIVPNTKAVIVGRVVDVAPPSQLITPGAKAPGQMQPGVVTVQIEVAVAVHPVNGVASDMVLVRKSKAIAEAERQDKQGPQLLS